MNRKSFSASSAYEAPAALIEAAIYAPWIIGTFWLSVFSLI